MDFLRDFVVGRFMRVWKMRLSYLLLPPSHSLINGFVRNVSDMRYFENIGHSSGNSLSWSFWHMPLEDIYHVVNWVLQPEGILWQIDQ